MCRNALPARCRHRKRRGVEASDLPPRRAVPIRIVLLARLTLGAVIPADGFAARHAPDPASAPTVTAPTAAAPAERSAPLPADLASTVAKDGYDVENRQGGGAEPVDPAEQRPARMPPVRPDIERETRGATAAWVDRGPGPTRSAQVAVPPNNEVCGAIQALAPHPTNANVLYVGAVNGGVWRTTNALASSPTWTPLTDSRPSQSIGALDLDPTDASSSTLLAGRSPR